MVWVVIGAAVALTLVFWQKIIAWANGLLAGWLGDLFGEDLREAFLMLLAAGDRFVVIGQRALSLLRERIVRARLVFQRVTGGQEHQKILVAELKRDDGEVVRMEAAEVIPWHELPDEVREKFIRRQTTNVEMELQIKG